MGIVKAICLLIRAFLVPRLILAAENLALWQQVGVRERLRARRRAKPNTGHRAIVCHGGRLAGVQIGQVTDFLTATLAVSGSREDRCRGLRRGGASGERKKNGARRPRAAQQRLGSPLVSPGYNHDPGSRRIRR